MSALDDAKRYLWLLGAQTADEPVQLLRDLVAYADRTGFDVRLLGENVNLKRRIAELETEKVELRKKLSANIEQLKAQLSADYQQKRIDKLEAELKESKAQTAAFRRAVVGKGNQDSKR